MEEITPVLFFLVIISLFLVVRIRPDNRRFKETLDSFSKNDLIVIFNSGGWGYTPSEKSADFIPIMEGIEQSLRDLGYNPAIVNFFRAKNNYLGKFTALKDIILNSFKNQTSILSREIEDFLNVNKEKKIIMVGLSAGATFADIVIGKIPENMKNRILAIEVGPYTWERKLSSENIFRFNNKGRDPISRGNRIKAAGGYLKIYLKWILAAASGRKITLAEIIHSEGHDYSWQEIKPEIVSFLENRLKRG